MSYRLTETLATFNAGAVTEVHYFDTWDEAMEHVSERASAMTDDEREEYFFTLRLEGAEYELDYEPDEVDLELLKKHGEV